MKQITRQQFKNMDIPDQINFMRELNTGEAEFVENKMYKGVEDLFESFKN